VLIKIRVCRRVVRRHRLIEARRLLTLHAQRRLLGLILLLHFVQPPHGQPKLPTSRDRRFLFQFYLTIKRVLDLSTGLLNHWRSGNLQLIRSSFNADLGTRMFIIQQTLKRIVQLYFLSHSLLAASSRRYLKTIVVVLRKWPTSLLMLVRIFLRFSKWKWF
jgi:hypothetical protein